jgi:hypothetical protein
MAVIHLVFFFFLGKMHAYWRLSQIHQSWKRSFGCEVCLRAKGNHFLRLFKKWRVNPQY